MCLFSKCIIKLNLMSSDEERCNLCQEGLSAYQGCKALTCVRVDLDRCYKLHSNQISYSHQTIPIDTSYWPKANPTFDTTTWIMDCKNQISYFHRLFFYWVCLLTLKLQFVLETSKIEYAGVRPADCVTHFQLPWIKTMLIMAHL